MWNGAQRPPSSEFWLLDSQFPIRYGAFSAVGRLPHQMIFRLSP